MAALMRTITRSAINGFPSPELDHDHVGLKAIKLKQEKETHAGTTIICSHLLVLSQENDENDCCPPACCWPEKETEREAIVGRSYDRSRFCGLFL